MSPLLYMNSIKLLVCVAVMFLAVLSARAQSVLEDLIFESATASSILVEQVRPDASAAGARSIRDASIGGNNTVLAQGTIASGPGQTGQAGFTVEFNYNGSSGAAFDDISSVNVVAAPEPSSLSLFGAGGVPIASRVVCRQREFGPPRFSSQTNSWHILKIPPPSR